MIDSKKSLTAQEVSPVISPESKKDDTQKPAFKRMMTKSKGGADADYNPYFYPPDLQIAQLHGRATMAGNALNVFDLKDEQFQEKDPKLHAELTSVAAQICPCCGKDENGKLVSLFTRSVDLGRLGTAIPGFFDYSKFLIFSMLLATLIYSIYTMVNYSRQNKCGYDTDHYSNLHCGAKWKFYLSWASIPKFAIDQTERILYVIAMVAIYCLKVYYYRRFRKLEADTDERVTDITDYTVELRGLPEDVTKKEIIDFFQSQTLKNDQDQEIKINAQVINFVYRDSQRVLDADNQLKIQIGQLVHAFKKNDPKAAELETSLKQKLAETKTMMETEFFSNRVTKKENKNFIGSAYVSFETQDQKETVEKRLAIHGFGKLIYKIFGGVRGPLSIFAIGRLHKLYPEMPGFFYIERAEAPSEIVFTNLGLGFLNRFLRRLFSFICSLLMITGTFIIIFVLKGAQSGLKTTGTKQTNSPLVVLITVLIKIAGFVLETVTPILVEFERPETFTVRNIGMIWRSSISVFLNSAVVITIANIYYQRDELDDTFYTDNGLASDLLFLLIFACLEAVFAVFIPGFVLTLCKRYKLRKDGEKSETFQYQANELHEGMPFIYPRRFGKYCNLLLITFFQISIFPYAPLLAIANLVLFLAADRYFLLRLAKVPEYCSTELSLSMVRFSDMIFVAWSGGYLVFEIINNNNEITNWTIVTFSLALANLVFNPNFFFRKIFKFEANEADTAVTDLKKFLLESEDPDTYRRRNPIYMLQARLHVYLKPEYIERCKQNMKDLSIDSADENDSMQEIFKDQVAREEQREIKEAQLMGDEDVRESNFEGLQPTIHYSHGTMIGQVNKPKDGIASTGQLDPEKHILLEVRKE